MLPAADAGRGDVMSPRAARLRASRCGETRRRPQPVPQIRWPGRRLQLVASSGATRLCAKRPG